MNAAGCMSVSRAQCSTQRVARGAALLTRDRYNLRAWNGPGSAVHHFVLHRVRDTSREVG